MHRSVALSLAATLTLVGLSFSSPATADPAGAASSSRAKTCHDSSAIRHAKHRLRVTVNHERSRYRNEVVEAQDQLQIDQLAAQNDLADSGTTAAEKAFNQARIDQDNADITAYADASISAANDSAYLKRCGLKVLTKGTRRFTKHALLLEIGLLKGTLIGQNGTLAYDQGELWDAMAGEDPLEIAQAKAALRQDQNAINKTRDEIASLVGQVRSGKF